MAKRFRLRGGEPLLDIVSYGSSALHENGGRLTPEQVAQVRRTVQRVPEVMVKVLPRASNDLKAAGKHLDYISRHGTLPLEMDDGERSGGSKGEWRSWRSGISISTTCGGRRVSLRSTDESRRSSFTS